MFRTPAQGITNGILGPNAIAIDSLGNIWVENDYLNVTIYESTFPAYPASALGRTFTPTGPVYGIAFEHGEFLWGSSKSVSVATEVRY